MDRSKFWNADWIGFMSQPDPCSRAIYRFKAQRIKTDVENDEWHGVDCSIAKSNVKYSIDPNSFVNHRIESMIDQQNQREQSILANFLSSDCRTTGLIWGSLLPDRWTMSVFPMSIIFCKKWNGGQSSKCVQFFLVVDLYEARACCGMLREWSIRSDQRKQNPIEFQELDTTSSGRWWKP